MITDTQKEKNPATAILDANTGLLELAFEIIGGGYELMANPMPKLRYTGKQSWLPRVQNYVQWKEHVQSELLDALQQAHPQWYKLTAERLATGLKPLDTAKQPITMHVHIGWRGYAHADPEGVFGSIADALLQNDKYLSGSFTYTHLLKTAVPYVTVKLQLPSNLYD